MRHHTPRRAAALLAALGLALTACGASAGDAAGGGGGGPVTVEAGSFSGAKGAAALSRTAEATADAGTYRMSMTSRMEGLGGADGFTTTMEGAIDTDAGRSQMTTSIDDRDLGTGDLGLDMEMILDGTTAYVRSDIFAAMSDSKKPWLKADLGDLTGVDTSTLGASGQDPTKFLDVLEEVAGPVETVGEEDVRGVATTHVRATVDFADMIAASANAAAVEPMLDDLDLEAGDIPDVPFDVWVDEDGLVRRITVSMDMGAMLGNLDEDVPDSMGDLRMVQTVEMYDFGKPVDIEVPPADQVGELELPGLGD